MSHTIRRADYFHLTVQDEPGEAYKLLSLLAERGINLLAFTTVPTDVVSTQLTLFPEDPERLVAEARVGGLVLDGPYPALLVQGDDVVGALAKAHRKLYEANVNIFASTGVSGGRGGYGYIIYLRPEELDRALEVLGA